MKKTNLTGWKDVFSFTLIQTLKSKAFIISYLIMLMLLLISMPIISMVTNKGGSENNAASPVKKVYVNNETNLPGMDFSEVLKDDRFSHITFEYIEDNYAAVSKQIEEKEQASIILTLTENAGNYSLNFVSSNKGSIKESGIKPLADAIVEHFENFKMNELGINEDQLAMIHAEVKTKVSMADVNGVEIVKEDTSISSTQYWFIYGILFVVMMVNIMASTQIAYSIVTEKSTKVIEYLLTSVKPLAIMVGKILAMLTAVLLQFISMGVVLFVSNKISASMASGSRDSIMSQYLPKDILQNLNIINLLICLVLIILGMIFYATLAGLAGATVSKLEEIQEGLTVFTFTNMIGAYLGIAAAGILMGPGVNSFVTFTFLFPLSSPFILPGAILIGKASLLMIAAALVLQLVAIALLFIFTAKVYETLILHNGNKIKIKDLIKLSKTV